MTKGVIAEGDQLKHGPNWIFSRRGMLKIFDDHLECGNWTIEYGNIKNTILYSVYFMIPGYVLKIETEDKTYYFGLNPGRYWKRELPFPVERQKGRLKYSWFSIVIRLILLGYIVYFLWRVFSH